MSDPAEQTTLVGDLRALDQELDRIRRRMYMVRVGLIAVDDRDRELADLEARFQELGDRFVQTYRRWQEGERRLETE